MWYIHTMDYYSEKEWSTYICYNVDKSQKHYAKWKKPGAKGLVMYGSIYIKYPVQ